MVIVTGWLQVEPLMRQSFLSGCEPVIRQARAHPECSQYVLAPDPILADRVHVFEAWETPEAVTRFREKGQQPAVMRLIADAKVEQFQAQACPQ